MSKITYKLKIKLVTPMLGTIPMNKEVYSKFVAVKAVEKGLQDEEVETVQEIEEKGWTGFHQDENGLFVYDYLVKGFLKEAANVLKDNIGIKNARAKLDSYVFVSPRRIYLGKEKPDGVLERPLRAMTMQGPRVSLAKSDLVNEGTEIVVEITNLNEALFPKKKLCELLDYGAFKGLGQFRNGGYGKFEYEFLE